jgi:hypothetical protein
VLPSRAVILGATTVLFDCTATRAFGLRRNVSTDSFDNSAPEAVIYLAATPLPVWASCVLFAASG